MHERGTDRGLTLAELRLDDLIAHAIRVRLPAPRTPARVIDLTRPATAAAPSVLTIPDATVRIVDGYDDYGS